MIQWILSKFVFFSPGKPRGPCGPGGPAGPDGPGGPEAKLDNLIAVLNAVTYSIPNKY